MRDRLRQVAYLIMTDRVKRQARPTIERSLLPFTKVSNNDLFIAQWARMEQGFLANCTTLLFDMDITLTKGKK